MIRVGPENRMPLDPYKNVTKNAAPKGRIRVGWVAELFFQSFFIFLLIQ